ncbi:NAD(+)--rifampin ADP-ribosyltransferase [Fundicoccus culcitae]|uniref:NAD(+)--rifampin ADP-ribosyltransferase n=1 Tax=Fundicoccus culcitae TaxID=2969821 RepID=A0ABY5P7S8_9LACT|nr:NAD(+)--rifampin ADP-ribosyltransferase [Fundicoccus culcitae]UUX34796.1 NAD(+)--rifampin ADP-ribosyltransferase [Fundicoccus culcitae]
MFDPSNPVVKLCMEGLALEAKGETNQAQMMFMKAWEVATDDFERFIAAFHLGRLQNELTDKLNWFETSLRYARLMDDNNVKSAYATLYENIAKCYQALNDVENAALNFEAANDYRGKVFDQGPFYHGTRADLQIGDSLKAGLNSNYRQELKMNHSYFTANLNGAALAAALAKGEGKERIFIVEATGAIENDPNVTDQKFPGNLTRSYRSAAPLKIIGEVSEWATMSDSSRQEWQAKIDQNKGEIFN